MELEEIINAVKPILQFRYVTVDRVSVKFWTEKPTYNNRCRLWVGDSCCGMFDLIGKVNLEEYRVNKMISYARALKEVI